MLFTRTHRGLIPTDFIFFAQAILCSGGVRHIVRNALYSVYQAVYRLAWRQRAQRAHEEHVVLSINNFNEQPNKKEQASFSSVTCHCLLAARADDAWRKTDELFQDSDRHLGVWNFRRIVFHASLQVESSCYRFFLCWSPLTSVNERFQMARVAPFVHGSHARGRGQSFPPQSVRQKQTNGRQRTFVRKKSSFVKISNE